MYKYKYIILLLTLIIAISPLRACAQIIITEVMYDLEGTDGGYEWVEIFNSYESDRDITTYKLFENNVNHKISPETPESESALGSGEYAVIADNVSKFREKNPDYNGTLFDSAFSLNNSGETISIYNAEGLLEDAINYSSDMGASGTGNSLQRSDGVIIPALPTPGSENETVAASEDQSGSDDNDQEKDADGNQNNSKDDTTNKSGESSHSSQIPLSNLKDNSPLIIGVGRERETTVHTPIKFNLITKEDQNVRNVKWSFGDGESSAGKTVTHEYLFPGEYVVIANASNKTQNGVSRTKVRVYEPDLSLSIYNDNYKYLQLNNNSDQEVNVGGYSVYWFGKRYRLSDDTIILAKQSITFDYENMSLHVERDENIDNGLYFPNGHIASSYEVDLKTIALSADSLIEICDELRQKATSCQL